MQKCKRCGYRKVKVVTEFDPRSGLASRVLTVCTNCQRVIKEKKIKKRWPWA